MPKNPGKKSPDLIRQEGRTAKAQGKRPSDNPYRGSSFFLKAIRNMRKDKWLKNCGMKAMGHQSKHPPKVVRSFLLKTFSPRE